MGLNFILLVLIVGCAATPAAESTVPDESTTTTGPTTTTTIAITTIAAPTTTTTEAAIDLDWFRIEPIVLEAQCFDTTGANVTVEPDVWIEDSSGNLIVWTYGPTTVVYEIHGGEHVETFNLEVTGPSPQAGHYGWTIEEHSISTPSCEYELTAEVVRVIER